MAKVTVPVIRPEDFQFFKENVKDMQAASHTEWLAQNRELTEKLKVAGHTPVERVLRRSDFSRLLTGDGRGLDWDKINRFSRVQTTSPGLSTRILLALFLPALVGAGLILIPGFQGISVELVPIVAGVISGIVVAAIIQRRFFYFSSVRFHLLLAASGVFAFLFSWFVTINLVLIAVRIIVAIARHQ